MRILQISRHHWHYAVGGTEVYLRDLVNTLRQRGHVIPVLTFQGSAEYPRDEDAGSSVIPPIDEIGEPDFRRVAAQFLDASRPQVGHFHSLKWEELVVAEELQKRGIPYVLTYHHPGFSCYRGNLLRWGTDICDGKVNVLKCASCRIASRTKLPKAIAYVVASAIGVTSPALRLALSRGLHANLDYWASTSESTRILHGVLGGCDTVLACAQWTLDVLRLNGVQDCRVRLVPQGLGDRSRSVVAQRARSERKTVNVGFVGRICREKGLDVLVGAMRRVPHRNLRLLVVGWDSDPRNPLEPLLRESARGDHRIRFLGKLTPTQTSEIYTEFDYLAVPSTWLETGPLVVWEALSHGVPVLASARIGHPALLDEGRGLLVEPHSVKRWSEVLTAAAEGVLQLAVKPGTKLRTMDDVALECEALYRSIPGLVAWSLPTTLGAPDDAEKEERNAQSERYCVPQTRGGS